MSKLSGIDYLSDTEKDIINFIKDKIENLSEFTMDEHPNHIFYMNKKHKCILEYNTEKACLFISNNFLAVLNTKYKPFPIKFFKILEVIKYSKKIQYKREYDYYIPIIKYMVECVYKLNVEIVYDQISDWSYEAEDVYKLKVYLNKLTN